MLFDLSNPRRKNVVRVVYAMLAIVFGGGFIFFGIGTETGGGGLFDGLFGGGGSSTASQYEQQIEDAEEKLEADPENQRALADLAQYRALSGQAQLEVDESTGQVTAVTDEARDEFESASTAWNRYLDAEPKKVDVATASGIVSAYQYLGDARGAAEAQVILARQDPSVQSYVQLAYYRYFIPDLKGGDKARDLALAEAKPAQRKEAEQVLGQYRKQAVKYKKQLAKLPESGAGGESAIENPFGSLGPDSGAGNALPPPTP